MPRIKFIAVNYKLNYIRMTSYDILGDRKKK